MPLQPQGAAVAAVAVAAVGLAVPPDPSKVAVEQQGLPAASSGLERSAEAVAGQQGNLPPTPQDAGAKDKDKDADVEEVRGRERSLRREAPLQQQGWRGQG
eukprot:10194927-Alexandrium_andersonii.AAC.1